MAAKLRKGDKVVVLAGRDKGKEGTIASVDPKAGKAVVDGVNMAIRHTRQTQTSQGGRLPKALLYGASFHVVTLGTGRARQTSTRACTSGCRTTASRSPALPSRKDGATPLRHVR